jgi:mannan endo-1,4-beta-mannosidase
MTRWYRASDGQDRRRWRALIRIAGVALIVSAAIIVAVGRLDRPAAGGRPDSPAVPAALSAGPLPHRPETYLGVYAARKSLSYAGVTAFTRTTGVTPDLVTYYSAWFEPFRASFARTAAKHGAVPLVQIEPAHVGLTAIAAGKYDSYLSDFAAAVRSYHYPVILSFGHEMNGSWYSWSHGHASPKAFVAAWRHIVTLFRTLGAGNVTWLWTVNVIDTRHDSIPSPAPWWPGSKYVNWVGIDGYFNKPSYAFAPLFGPTIVKVRELTRDPILIAETAVAPVAGQPAKIADLFAGVRTFGLLGFVWFDADKHWNWRIRTPAAAAAFLLGARAYKLPAL